MPLPLEDVVGEQPGPARLPRDLPAAVRLQHLDASSQVVGALAVGLNTHSALGRPGLGEDHADPKASCRVLEEG